MGAGLVFKCKNCNYELDVNLGIGFRYTYLCSNLLENMKTGKMGKTFQNAANSIENPAVYASKSLYLCENCGELKPALNIALCSPINEPKEKNRCFSTVCECFEYNTYVMAYELNNTYKTVHLKEYRCGKCKTKMKKITSYRNLKCPQCQNKLKSSEYFWD